MSQLIGGRIQGKTLSRLWGLLVVIFLCLLASPQEAKAQYNTPKKQYKGVLRPKTAGKRRKKYKHLRNKKSRKNIKYKSKYKSRSRRASRKRVRNFKRKKSLYSSKKRRPKGKYARTKKDFGSKASISVYVGGTATGQEQLLGVENTDVSSDMEVLSTEVRQVQPLIGVGGEIRLLPRVLFIFDASYLMLGTENVKMSSGSASVGLKFSFAHPRNAFRPYASLSVGLSSANMSWDPTVVRWYPEDNSTSGDGIPVSYFEKTYAGGSTGTIPMLGTKIGLGADFKINNKVDFFFQVNLHYRMLSEEADFIEQYPNAKTNFSFMSGVVGVRIGLFRSKSLY